METFIKDIKHRMTSDKLMLNDDKTELINCSNITTSFKKRCC